ncbi:MAG: ABC transporter permease [Ruminococcus sp.]
MSNGVAAKHSHEPLFRVVKRDDLKWWQAWLVRIGAIIIALLLVGLISVLLTKENFFTVYETMYRGTFGRLETGNTRMLWVFLQNTAILLGLSLAVTPAFKMKFWNCGAEGQALIGGLASMICMIELGDKLPYPVLLLVILVSSMLAGAIWGVIPAVFKAQYNTNETLFTLMMNYVATQIIKYYLYLKGGGSNKINPVDTGNLPVIGDNKYMLNVIIVLVLTVGVYIYLNYSKHGYEISVVGESQNTARYVGINIKKVIIRTMIISGAICGIVGMLLVAGTNHSIDTTTVGGQGFTAIMVSWLGQFNPFIMVLMSALVIFLDSGSGKLADSCGLNSAYADITVGIVILFVVGCEFFIRYSVKFRHIKKEVKA